jgi:hypothetical protein
MLAGAFVCPGSMMRNNSKPHLDLLLQCYDRSQKSNSAYRGGNNETLGRHATLQLVAPVWDGVAGAPVASLAQSRGSRRSSMLSHSRMCCNTRAVFQTTSKSLARGAGIVRLNAFCIRLR